MPARTRYRMVATTTDGTPPRDDFTRELDQSNTAYTALSLPAPLYYQPANMGHEAAMTVGAVETVTMTPDDVTVLGYFLDGDEDEAEMPRIAALAREAVGMAKQKLVRPSVDPGVLEVGENESGEPALTKADLSGVTLVGMPAMVDAVIEIIEAAEAPEDIPADMPVPDEAEARAIADEADDEGALVAAVRREGWADMPIAGRDREWDGDAAAQRLAAACDLDAEGDPGAEAWNCYAAGFLWVDDENRETRGAYKLGIVDIADGERVIVPAAVFAVASVLGGGRGGVDIPETDQATIRGVLDGLYGRMAEQFDDDALTAPWAEASARMAALVAAVAEAPPVEAFERPDIGAAFDGYRIEGRRIFGNLYPVGACHLNWSDKCVTAPESPSGYALFRRYMLTTSAGEIPVGRITTGLGKVGTGCACCDPEKLDDHACPRRMGLVAAMAHHDRMATVADVNIGEHEGAIWLSGIVRDGLDAEAERVLARRVWSGDWRPAGDADELVEVLALHHGQPAFATHVAHSRSRGVLIASTGPTTPDAPAAAGLSAADVVRTVQGLDAARGLEAALTAAGHASALATLTELERM